MPLGGTVADNGRRVRRGRLASFFPVDEEALRPLCEAFDAFLPLQPVFAPLWDRGYWAWLRHGYKRADVEDFEWTTDFLRGVHRVATKHRPDASRPDLAGKLRTTEHRSTMTDGSGSFVAAPPKEIPGLVDVALETVREWDGHPALAAPWINIVLTAVHPFQHVNDSLSRVAGCVALYRHGYRAPLLPDCSIGDKRGMYVAEQCLGSRFDPTADVTAFCRWYLRAQIQRAFHWVDDLWIGDPDLFERLRVLQLPSGEGALARAIRLANNADGASA